MWLSVNSCPAVFFNYLWLSCIFIVLYFQFNFVWSTHYSTVFMSTLPSLAWPCLASLKTSICDYSSSPCSSLIPPLNVHRARRPDQTVSCAPSPRFVLFLFWKVFIVPICLSRGSPKSTVRGRSRSPSAAHPGLPVAGDSCLVKCDY